MLLYHDPVFDLWWEAWQSYNNDDGSLTGREKSLYINVLDVLYQLEISTVELTDKWDIVIYLVVDDYWWAEWSKLTSTAAAWKIFQEDICLGEGEYVMDRKHHAVLDFIYRQILGVNTFVDKSILLVVGGLDNDLSFQKKDKAYKMVNDSLEAMRSEICFVETNGYLPERIKLYKKVQRLIANMENSNA
jgi:hypothetical protein